MSDNNKTAIDYLEERRKALGSLTALASDLGTSRRSLGRYINGEVPVPDAIIDRLDIGNAFAERIEHPVAVVPEPVSHPSHGEDFVEISSRDLIEEAMEINNGNATKTALSIGVSRRSLGRYANGEVDLPEEVRERLESFVSENRESITLNPASPDIPAVMPHADEGDVLYFQAKVGKPGTHMSIPLLTVATEMDFSPEKCPFAVIRGADGCAILVNPDHIKDDVFAEYMSEESPEVQFYRENAMSFNHDDAAYSMTEGRFPSLSLVDSPDDTISEILHGEFEGSDKQDITFIVLSKDVSEKLYDRLKSVEHEQGLNRVRSIHNTPSL